MPQDKLYRMTKQNKQLKARIAVLEAFVKAWDEYDELPDKATNQGVLAMHKIRVARFTVGEVK